jgi:arsenate reductase-like glutaredoxin family protein
MDITIFHNERCSLLNRPFVVTSKGVRLCRPPERVAEIL